MTTLEMTPKTTTDAASDNYFLSSDTMSSFFLQFSNPIDNDNFKTWSIKRSQSTSARLQLGFICFLTVVKMGSQLIFYKPNLYFFLHLLGVLNLLPLILLPSDKRYEGTRQVLRWLVYGNTLTHLLSICK